MIPLSSSYSSLFSRHVDTKQQPFAPELTPEARCPTPLLSDTDDTLDTERHTFISTPSSMLSRLSSNFCEEPSFCFDLNRVAKALDELEDDDTARVESSSLAELGEWASTDAIHPLTQSRANSRSSVTTSSESDDDYGLLWFGGSKSDTEDDLDSIDGEFREDLNSDKKSLYSQSQDQEPSSVISRDQSSGLSRTLSCIDSAIQKAENKQSLSRLNSPEEKAKHIDAENTPLKSLANGVKEISRSIGCLDLKAYTEGVILKPISISRYRVSNDRPVANKRRLNDYKHDLSATDLSKKDNDNEPLQVNSSGKFIQKGVERTLTQATFFSERYEEIPQQTNSRFNEVYGKRGRLLAPSEFT